MEDNSLVKSTHNQQETPLFAKSIERHALRQADINRRKHGTAHV